MNKKSKNVFTSMSFAAVPVPEMTYNVFSGTLNPTHFTLPQLFGVRSVSSGV